MPRREKRLLGPVHSMDEEDLSRLCARLTVEEKVGQLIQLSGEFFTDDEELLTGPRERLGIDSETAGLAGSVLNVCGAERIRAVQDAYLARSRHKIPLMFMADVEYGYRTAFPAPLGLGATWNPELVERCYRASAVEMRAAGVNVTFGPMVDLVRDARWGRCLESPGEDPWLNSEYAGRMVRGLQGQGPDFGNGVAACVKHFAAYGAVEAGREYNTVDLSERSLRQDYLPSYRGAIDAGCAMVMTSFNTVDGVPATASTHLMRDILRGEWGFDGVLISDYAAVHELVAHGIARDDEEATELAMRSGVDIDMKTACYANHLPRLVREGVVSENLLDEAVMRVLRLKNRLGLFEDPYRGASPESEALLFCRPETLDLAREAAEQAVVLLKNEGGILPIDPACVDGPSRIALIGPYARSRELVGLWAVHADLDRVETLEQALSDELGPGRVCAASGCAYIDDTSHLGFFGHSDPASTETRPAEELHREALALAASADVVIMALGEHPMESGEGGSKADISLPRRQKELLAEVRALGKPVVLVVFSGRPVALGDVEPFADAILQAFYPGTKGSRAIARIISGAVNPSGRLTMTFPFETGQEPIYYNAFNTGRPEKGSSHTNRFTSRYVDCPTEPLYPFGYGLSYHTAAYERLELSCGRIERGGSVLAAVEVAHTGGRAGYEVVQLYIRDVTGSVVRPIRELKGFEKIWLEPGERRRVAFEISEEMLRFYRRDMTWGSEPGIFEVMVGPNCTEVLRARLELVDGCVEPDQGRRG